MALTKVPNTMTTITGPTIQRFTSGSGTNVSATYKLQIRDNLGVGVTITNFRFNWHYL